MMANGRAFRFNHETFAYESSDDEGEIVVLNHVDGTYYAFGGAAVHAWPYLVAQYPDLLIASALATGYGVEPSTLNIDLMEFVERLLNEKILLTAAETTSQMVSFQPGGLGEYRGFNFERHADMADLLTLDPIHDVP
jgi:hypothetical protein